MTQRLSPFARRAAIGTAVSAALVLLLAPWWASAEPEPGKNDRIVARIVTSALEQGHVTHMPIGDEVSKRLFNRFLKELDAGKLYFLKSDIEEFKKNETDLDDMLHKGDIKFAYEVYERLVKRIGERLKLIDALIDEKHDFTKKEYLETDPKKLQYLDDGPELHDRWRKRIKFDLLLQKIGAKPVTDAEAQQKVRDRYHGFYKRMKKLDNYDLLELYLSAFSASLDPHGAYMSPNSVDDFEIAMRLQLDGIGALLREENGQTIIVEIVPGGAAAKDGRLKPNDKIIGVAQGDGKFVDVVDMRLRETVKLIRGSKGTKVELKVVPAGKVEPVIYALTRARIEMKSQAARYEIIEDGKKADGKPFKIGIIDLPSFYSAGPNKQTGGIQSASEDVRRILGELKEAGVDGVVLDMRNNPGGFLQEAIALAGLFIAKGPVVQVKDDEGVRRHTDPDPGVVYGGPLVVVVNRHSASAAEIVAATLQDYGRAVIVGDSATHGKGTVQTVVSVGDLIRQPKARLGALRLTVQQFYRVNGDSTQNKGVESDIVLPSLSEYLATPEKEMDYALPFDKIAPAEHKNSGMVTKELVAKLKQQSAERVKESKDFAKLAKEIDRVKMLRERKKMPLSEAELKQQMSKDEADKVEKGTDGQPEEPKHKEKYKYDRNFINNEVLKILEDLLQAKRPAAPQTRLHVQPAPFRTEWTIAAR